MKERLNIVLKVSITDSSPQFFEYFMGEYIINKDFMIRHLLLAYTSIPDSSIQLAENYNSDYKNGIINSQAEIVKYQH